MPNLESPSDGSEGGQEASSQDPHPLLAMDGIGRRVPGVCFRCFWQADDDDYDDAPCVDKDLAVPLRILQYLVYWECPECVACAVVAKSRKRVRTTAIAQEIASIVLRLFGNTSEFRGTALTGLMQLSKRLWKLAREGQRARRPRREVSTRRWRRHVSFLDALRRHASSGSALR